MSDSWYHSILNPGCGVNLNSYSAVQSLYPINTPKTMIQTRDSAYSSNSYHIKPLLNESKLILCYWDRNKFFEDNANTILLENPLGLPRRSQVQHCLQAFFRRYANLIHTLTYFAQTKEGYSLLDTILYFHTAHPNKLLFDVVTTILFPLYKQGLLNIDIETLKPLLSKLVSKQCTWSESTLLQTCKNLLNALYKFGIIQGKEEKQITQPYLPIKAFAYIAFYLKQLNTSSLELLDDPHWKLFLLSDLEVEKLFLEAHQHNLLEYYAAGTTIRLTFPAQTLEQYVQFMLTPSPNP